MWVQVTAVSGVTTHLQLPQCIPLHPQPPLSTSHTVILQMELIKNPVILHSGCDYWEEISSHLPGFQYCKYLRRLGTMEIMQYSNLSGRSNFAYHCQLLETVIRFCFWNLEHMFEVRFQPERVSSQRTRTSSES
jgi:hypothetical protein